MALGAKLRELRVKQRESLQDVATAVGASKPHIWELETGRAKNPSLKLIQRLAEHFKVSPSYLLDDAPGEEVMQFWKEFKGLTEEDWKMLRTVADRMKKNAPD